jgi:eukaryotic-like serine/threonine-protein kinase
MSGWQLAGFEELGELGVGGGGRVVLARHESTGRDVAVKYLASWLVDSPERLADFRTEAELMAGLVDDNLVTLYEYVETDVGAAIAMELVEGVALRAILEEGGPLTPEASLTLMKGSLRGLGALHRQGVVHRDYKPENVMVDGAGATKLVDYGIAAPVGELAGIAGTPLYMAPEQWAGEPSTAASDVYAASATFVESLTGHTVFTATTVDALRSQHFSAQPSLEGVPPEVRVIAEAGLAKDPAERITDAEALVEKLEGVAGNTYGPDWEERGRRHLAARASLLALLFPHARLKITQHATALTELGSATAPKGFWAGLRPRSRGGVLVGKWGLAAACALIVAAGAGAGAMARAADGTAESAAAANNQLAPTVLVATSPSPTPTPTPKPTPKGKAKHKAKPKVAPATPTPGPADAPIIQPPVQNYTPPPVNFPPVQPPVVVPVTTPPAPPLKTSPPTVAPTTSPASPKPTEAPPTIPPSSPPTCVDPRTGGPC